MIMTLHENEEWDRDDRCDQEQVNDLTEAKDEGYQDDKLSKEMLSRWDSLDEKEKHDLEMVKQGRYNQLTKYMETEEKKIHCPLQMTYWRAKVQLQ